MFSQLVSKSSATSMYCRRSFRRSRIAHLLGTAERGCATRQSPPSHTSMWRLPLGDATLHRFRVKTLPGQASRSPCLAEEIATFPLRSGTRPLPGAGHGLHDCASVHKPVIGARCVTNSRRVDNDGNGRGAGAGCGCVPKKRRALPIILPADQCAPPKGPAADDGWCMSTQRMFPAKCLLFLQNLLRKTRCARPMS